MSLFHYQLASGQFSTKLALASFGIGTLLFLLHLLHPHAMGIIISGFYFILIAFFINGLMLFYLAYCYLVFESQREFYAIKILIVVGNIPIAILYYLTISYQL
jgi:hypothetical protein